VSGRKEQLTVYLTSEQAAELRRLSARTRVPMNAYVRDAIDLVIAQNREKREVVDG